MDNNEKVPAAGAFDFEEWARLAREDPAAFEQRRREAVQAVIASAPEHLHQRLHGLQFRLDLERSRSSTPLGACVRLNSLMWAGFHRLRHELNAAAHPGQAAPTAGEPKHDAQVIAFTPRAGRGRDPSL